jgi:hypothetical protein
MASLHYFAPPQYAELYLAFAIIFWHTSALKQRLVTAVAQG